jgi:hypothetical protein
MPGLLRGVARTAVVAGTASAVSGRVQRRQQQKWGEQDAEQQPIAQEQAPASADDQYAELEKLGQLKAEGILTQEEFDAKKKQILGL